MNPVALQQETRRARIAVALLFLTNGAVPANLVPLFPSIKSGLGLSMPSSVSRLQPARSGR